MCIGGNRKVPEASSAGLGDDASAGWPPSSSMGRLVYDEAEGPDADTTIPVVYCDQPIQVEDSFRFDDPGAVRSSPDTSPATAIDVSRS
ncbi:MAG TPA: hypothetical protein VF119_10615 [Candidatus Limnocylindrales bacterium]